jgi:hypothetical protein
MSSKWLKGKFSSVGEEMEVWMAVGMRLGGRLRLGFSTSCSSNLIDCLVELLQEWSKDNRSLVMGKLEEGSWI